MNFIKHPVACCDCSFLSSLLSSAEACWNIKIYFCSFFFSIVLLTLLSFFLPLPPLPGFNSVSGANEMHWTWGRGGEYCLVNAFLPLFFLFLSVFHTLSLTIFWSSFGFNKEKNFNDWKCLNVLYVHWHVIKVWVGLQIFSSFLLAEKQRWWCHKCFILLYVPVLWRAST